MTQEERILEYLQGGGTLTALDALNLFGCFRLASRISELRKTHNIQSGTIETESGKHIKKYWLSDEPAPTEQEAMIAESNLHTEQNQRKAFEKNGQFCFIG